MPLERINIDSDLDAALGKPAGRGPSLLGRSPHSDQLAQVRRAARRALAGGEPLTRDERDLLLNALALEG